MRGGFCAGEKKFTWLGIQLSDVCTHYGRSIGSKGMHRVTIRWRLSCLLQPIWFQDMKWQCVAGSRNDIVFFATTLNIRGCNRPATASSSEWDPSEMASPVMVQTSLSFMAIQALAEIHRVFNRAERDKQDPCVPIVKEIMKARDKVIVLHGLGREGLIIRGFAMRLFHLGLRKVHMFGDMCTPLLKTGDLLIVTNGPGWPSSADSIIGEATASGARALVITAKPDGAAAALATTIALVPAQTMADADFPGEGEAAPEHPECSMMVEGKIPWQLAHSNQRPSMVPAGDAMAASPPGKTKLSAKLDEMIVKADADRAAAAAAAPRGSQRGSQVMRGSQMGGGSFRGSQIDGELKAGITLYTPEHARFVVTDNKILPMGSAYEGALFILFEIVVYTLREKLQETLPVMRGRNTNLDHFPPSHACGPPPPTPPDECGRYHKHPPTSDSGLPHTPFIEEDPASLAAAVAKLSTKK